MNFELEENLERTPASISEAMKAIESLINKNKSADTPWDDYIYIEKEARFYSKNLQSFFTAREVASNMQARTKREINDRDVNMALRDDKIKVYTDFCFGENEVGKYNLYNPWYLLQANTSNPDIHPEIINLLESLTWNNTEDMTYILKWITWKYLHPLSPMQSCLVFMGNQGVGKGHFWTLLQTIFSLKYTLLNVSPELFTKSFSVSKESTLVYELSEAWEDNHKIDAKNATKLKTLVMQNYVNLERKNENAEQVRNHTSFFINSNKSNPILFESKEIGNRRYSVFKWSWDNDDTKGAKIYKVITDKDIISQLLWFLLLEYWDEVKDMPVFSSHKNEVKDTMESNSWDEFQLFFKDLRENYHWELIPDTDIRRLFLKFLTERGSKLTLVSKLYSKLPWWEVRPKDSVGKTWPRHRLIR